MTTPWWAMVVGWGVPIRGQGRFVVMDGLNEVDATGKASENWASGLSMISLLWTARAKITLWRFVSLAAWQIFSYVYLHLNFMRRA